MSQKHFKSNYAVDDVSKRQINLLFGKIFAETNRYIFWDNLEQTDQLRRCEKKIKGLQRQTGIWRREVYGVDEIISDRRNEIRSLDRLLSEE